MKAANLSGAALDWAVAKCENKNFELVESFLDYYDEGGMHYADDWSQGGPIIEREGIGLDQYSDYPRWEAFTPAPEQASGYTTGKGPTPLIAAMRCYVASKLGDEVEIPRELQ